MFTRPAKQLLEKYSNKTFIFQNIFLSFLYVKDFIRVGLSTALIASGLTFAFVS